MANTEVNKYVYAAVAMTVSKMSTDEVCACVLHLTGSGTIAPEALGYEKIQHLLTQDGSTRMHHDTQAAFLHLALERVESEQAESAH